MFAKSGWDVTGQIDLKPLNFKIFLLGEDLSFSLLILITVGSLEKDLINLTFILDLILCSISFLTILDISLIVLKDLL